MSLSQPPGLSSSRKRSAVNVVWLLCRGLSVLPLPVVLLVLLPVVAPPCYGQETERQYLSGTGKDDTVQWEFEVTGGRRAGEQVTIPVPSQWELQGFGSYNYGHDDDKADEQGRYRYRFAPGKARMCASCSKA